MSDQKPWEDFAQQPSGSAAPKPWEEFGGTTKPEEKGVLGHARDFGLSVAQGVIGVPEAVVGLADIAAGGQVGKFLENQDGAIGFRPKQAREYLGSLMTDASKQQQQDFQNADGVIDKAKVALSNPSLITNTVGQSLPLMGAGGVAGRAVTMVPRIGGAVAGAIGEGIAGAGSAAEQIRQETDDGLLTGKQAGLAAASGAGTALFGAVAGKVAQRLGIGDIDTILATGGPTAVAATARTASKSLPRKALEGAISEGFLEELPQSLSEQVMQNLALDKPWTEGLSDQAVMGVLSGGLMGGLAGPIHGSAPDAKSAPAVAPTQNEQQRPVALLPAPVYDVGADGVVRTTDDRNTALDRTRRGEFTDVTATPAEPTIAEQPPPQLPAPVYQAGADGVVRTTADLNNATQAAAQARADRLDRIRRGDILDVTPIEGAPSASEQMGLNPAAGPMSTAAALAVDNGASQHMAQQAALQQAADAGQQQGKPANGKQVDPETGEITGAQGSLLANDPATELQGRLHFIQQTARANGWDMRLIAERDRVQAELAKLQPQQTQPPAAARQAPTTTPEDARQASAAPAADINATPNAPKPEAAHAGEPQQQPQAAPQVETAAAQPQSTPAAATPAVAPADESQPTNLKDAIAKVREGRVAQKQVKTPKSVPLTTANIEGKNLGEGWAEFHKDSGTIGIPRAEMPQIRAEHRGAMVNFMNARGVQHQEETVPAASLKPTQAEFSRDKVAKAKERTGGDRSILISRDGHVLDGHHQWMAAREKGEDVRAIRLDAPIRDLVSMAHEFPSSTVETSDPVAAGTVPQAAASEHIDAAAHEAGPMGRVEMPEGESAAEFPMKEAASSYSGISHSGDQRAKADAEEFQAYQDAARDSGMAIAHSDAQKAAVEQAAAALRDDYLAQYRRLMGVRAGTYSGYVAGRSGLNSKQAVNRNSAYDRAIDTFTTWQKANADRVRQAALDARTDDEKAADQRAAELARADKAQRKEDGNRSLMRKILSWTKGGDPVAITKTANLAGVNLGRDGYPTSVKLVPTDGSTLTDDKFDLAALFRDRGMSVPESKRRVRELVDAVRAEDAAQAQASPAAPQVATAAPAAGSKTPSLDAHVDFMKRVRAGDATADEFKAAFHLAEASGEAIAAELATMKKGDLLQSGGFSFYQRFRDEKKGAIVEALASRILDEYALGRSYGPSSYMMSAAGLEAHRQAKASALRDLVANTTTDDIKAHAAEIAEARKDVQARRDAQQKAVSNPQTLADFRQAVSYNMEAHGETRQQAFMRLTPDQRIRYDELEAESTKAQREQAKTQAKTRVASAGQTTAGDIIETKHTKHGHDLYVLQLAERVSREDYDTLNSSAKRLGGSYSSYRGNGAVPGFQFRTRETAEAFRKLVAGDTAEAQAVVEARRDAFDDDRSQSAVERLRTMADALDERADESLNRDRKTNTARRARMASSAEGAARADKALAGTMNNLASAIESGKAKFLDAVRQKVQVEFLSREQRNAKDAQIRAKYPSYGEQERHRGEPMDAETVDYANFPSYTAMRSDLASLARQMVDADGLKKLGARLEKVADDVTEAYTDWAKQNLLSVSRFTRGDQLADFKGREDAERAIRRSGLTGKAIVLPIKRGQNRIIMAPSEAMQQGLWTGDGDKRITLSGDFGSELVQALSRRSGSKITVPWALESAHDKRKRLEGMGIFTGSEYRSALREFAGIQEAIATPDKIKEMERAMIGRRADGLDFFPTSDAVVDTMLDAAEIESGMSVLEPSAGMGHIADAIREKSGAEPDVVELSGERRELLEAKGYHLAGNDFMAMEPRKFFTYGDVFRAPDGTVGIMHGGPAWSGRASLHAVNDDGSEGRMLGWFARDELTGIRQRGSWSGYDRIIMNPPFSKGRDIQHVMHAYELLRPGGRLVAIMGEGAFFQSNNAADNFRTWLDDLGATSEKLPEGSFMDPALPVNTGVSARMVVIDKPAVDEASPETTAPTEAGEPAVQFSFAGRKARGADMHALVSAQQRLMAGEAAETVRRETGWHLGADGKWRFEISDHLASIAVPGSTARSVVDMARLNALNDGRSRPLISDVLVHPRLFAAYPRLARIPIAMMPANATADARLRHLATGPVVEVQPNMAREALASTLVHELQHEIQNTEGFAKGGSADRFTSDFDKTGAVTYRRLAGEVEARNTQARMHMTPRQRLEVSPEESADVRSSRVLVTFNGREIVDGELPQNITGQPMMNAQKLVRAFDLQFPKLGKAVRIMLERGRRGMRGGVVMIDNNDPLQIAHAYATKTGTALSSAIRLFEDDGLINGFYDAKSGLTFLIGPNLDPITAPAVLLHEMTHGQQRQKLDQHAAEMLRKRASVRDRSLREFLDRAAGRMAAAGEEGNRREAAAYIVEQALIEGRSQGFTFADNRFLAWVDQTVGQRVGDFLRSFLATVRQWMLRNGVGLGPISVDDLVGYAMAGMERAARGDVRGKGVSLSQDDARKARVLQGSPVAVLTGKEAPIGFAAVREWATNLFKEQGGQALNPDLGEVLLDGRAVRDSMAHGKASPYKFAAFSAVKDVLERGALVHQAQYHKGESFYVSAPVVIDGKDDIVTVLVRRDSNMQRMYLHSVATKEYLLKSRVSGADTSGVEQPSGSSNSGDVASVLHRLLNARLGDEPDTGPQFSRAGLRDMAGRATQELNKTFSAPGGLSWWHKTIGTMYNLAQRSPAFRPVFESAQGFIDDVSHYANDAAEMAPKLLPKLDTWRDIAKAPVSASDNKAVAKPIFEGTLLWARDSAGKPARVADLAEAAARLSTEDKVAMLLEQGKIPEGMLHAWRGHSDDQFAKLIDSRFESQLLKPGVVWTDAELRGLFNLSDAQVALYHEFRAATDRSLDTMARADMLRYAGDDVKELRDRVMDATDVRATAMILRDHLAEMADAWPDRATHLMELAHGVMDRAEKVTQLQAEGYAPLSRFGKYTVDVVEEGGERQYFGLFETRREANQMAEQMRSAFPDAAVNQGTLSEESYKLFAGITPETLELFGNALGFDSQGDSERDQAFQEYLRLTKTNRSAMRRLIHRKGIAGYSEDVGRVLASFIYSNSRQTAAGLHMGDLSEAVDAIPKEQGELKDAAVRLADYIKNPQEEAQAVRGLLFAQYLGGSVASALVNMTQPAAVTFPWLSQFGGARKAATELGRAARQMATKGFKYEADLARALHDAEEDGTVSPQEVHQLMAQARGSGSLRAGDGTRVGDARALGANSLARLSVAWGKLFGAAEQVNRRVTFIAAYRMAKDRGMADPATFARRAVTETQFVYSKASKMQWGRGAVGGTLLTFKTYSIAYLELMSRLWSQGEEGSQERKDGRKAALLMLATLMLLGGAGGLPFAEDVDDVVDAMAQIAGYNFSAKRAKQEFLESVFGRDIASFIDKGITGLPGMPLDVSGRLGMGNLIPGTGLLTESNNHTRDVLEIVGPAGDFATRIVSGARKVAGGDIAGGLLETAPTAVRNLAKGADMAATGMYRDAKGYKVLDTNTMEAALKAVGFQPSSVATIQEANGLNQQAKAFYNLRAQEIRSMWAQGIFEKDQAKVQQARDAVADWNAKNPDQQMVVRMPDVLRRVREMAKPKDQRIADTAPKAMRQQMREDVARARADL